MQPHALEALINRRTMLATMVAGCGAAVLTACGGTAAPSASSAAPSSAPPTTVSASVAAASTSTSPSALAPASAAAAVKSSASPKVGGSLTGGIQTDLPNVDAHFNSPSGYDTLWVAFDQLTNFDDKMQVRPGLAESWDLSPDYKQVTFHLRKGVMFHSGREFTSDDVKYNMMRIRDPKINGGGWVAFSTPWTVDTPDKYTVTFKADQPQPLLFDNLEYLNIIDKNTAEGPDAKSKAVGTGPFVLQEWAQGQHVQLTKNKNYWQAGKPYLDAIEWKILSDAQAMVVQLESGALNAALNPPLADTSRLQSNPKYQAVTNPLTGRYYSAGWNVATKPLDNKLVRQALNFAMDRQRFVSTMLLGFAQSKSLPWIPGSPAYDATQNNFFAFDLDKSKALLGQAGVSGFDLEYLVSPNFPELVDFGQVYQADLAKVGVRLTIKQVDSATFFDAINNRKYPGMYVITNAKANLAPGVSILASAGYAPNQNNEGFHDDAYTALAVQTGTETDPQKQKSLYTQLNAMILDQAFYTAMSSASPRLLMGSNVQGLGYTQHEGFVWTNVWLA